jgi:DNA-binding transcriptional LysR family regulator
LRLTAAEVSRNVAMLERNLGVRLFQRSTRKLTLTEAGKRFLVSIDGNLHALQAAIAEAAAHNSEPAAVLRVSLSPDVWSHTYPALAAALLGEIPANQAGMALRESAYGLDRRELRRRHRW